jgi:(5-formylfuran-3-yl)methyl phosphate synthase
MTGLLVSVRSAEEACAARRGGATVIDVKEPTRGALGAADEAVWRQIQAAVPGAPLSAALGELLDPDSSARAARAGGFDWVKFGLAGAARHADWQRRLQEAIRGLPPGTAAVAVVYVDWSECDAPRPETVIDAALSQNLSGVLFDTFVKDRRCLFDWIDVTALRAHCRRIRRASPARIVLAGRLGLDDVASTVSCGPDLLGVRGAVCDGGRESSVREQLVVALSSRIVEESAAVSRNCASQFPVA